MVKAHKKGGYSMKEYMKVFFSFIAGVITTFFNMYGPIIGLVCFAIIFDVVTGVVGSKAAGRKISSKKAYKGFWKKVSLLLALVFGMFLDLFIPLSLKYVDIVIPYNMPFGLIFGCYIVFNESISICENIYKVDPTILPLWVRGMLLDGSKVINKNEKEEK